MVTDPLLALSESIKFENDSWVQVGDDIDGEAADDSSGMSVSMSSDGNTVAIGARYNDDNGSNAGHVRVYQLNGNSWVQVGLDIDGEASNDSSGDSVSMSSDGTTVAIGAYGNDGNGSGSGHVRIYQFNNGLWVKVGLDIDGEAAGDYSGDSVSMSSDGTTVAIGAYGNDGNGNYAGHVRIYTFNGSSWNQVGDDIDGEAVGDKSGQSVSMSSDGTTVAIGAGYNAGNGSNAGHVRIYKFDSSSWVKVGDDIDGEAVGDLSGSSVSMSSDGTTVAIGAYGNDGNGSFAGHVRIYQLNPPTLIGQATADVTGSYSITVSTLTEASHSITATATDAAGNESAASTTLTLVVDTTAPVISSSTTGMDPIENSGSGQTVYTIIASDAVGVVSNAIGGTDASLLSADSASGVVSLDANPDYETKSSYSFTVTASDAAGNASAATTVTFSITNVDEVAPTITSGATGTSLAENSGGGQTVYTISATANDGGTISSYAIGGTNSALLSVNPSTGVVKLTADPDYETKNSYSFSVTATDAAGTSNTKTVTFSITNVDEVVPTITSGATGANLVENSGAGQTVYTITATANDGGTISSYAIGGTDAGLLSVNSSTGVVSLTANPNYETQSSYSFTVTATDAAGTSNATAVTFSIFNVDEVVPTITSGATGTNFVENSGVGQTVYTIISTANDGGTISSYAIGGTDAALLAVNPTTGVVSLTADPDYETQSSYSFTVTATDAAGTSNATAVTFSIFNVDEVVPTITSGATGTNLVENSGAGQTVYTIAATANDGGTISSYAIGGTDAALLAVNPTTGVVSLTADPDYETRNSYSFTVTASDADGTSAATAVTFSIINVDDTVPTITSGATGTSLDENSGAGQSVYTITATANDGGTILSYAIGGTDAPLLSADSATGVVKLTADPDYETQSSYSFTVTATDAAGTSNATAVTLSIFNVDEVVPTITSGATGTNFVENSGAGQTVYTIISTANDGGTISSYAIGGTDSALLSVDSATGVVKLTADPDYETQSSYSFTVTATDAAGTSNTTAVTFSITDVDDTAPVVSSFTLSDVALKAGDSATVSLVFTEEVSDFSSDDITVANGTLGSMTSSDNITWTGTFTPTADTEDSSNILTLDGSYSDPAGNAGPAATTANYAVDTLSPGVPTVAVTNSTTDTTPAFTGTAEADSTVTLLVGETTELGQATADANGDYTFTPVTPMTFATHVVTVRATDAAGNVSSVSSDTSLVIYASDITQYPSIPMIIFAKLQHQDYTAVAGDIVRAYVGNELRAKAIVQIETATGNPVVALMVSVNGGGETLSNVFVESAAGAHHHFVVGGDSGQPLDQTQLVSGTMIGNPSRYIFDSALQTQTLAFKHGWNFVSMNVSKVDASTMTPAAYFGANDSKLAEIRTLTSQYNPTLASYLNTLTKIELGPGYWVKTSSAFNHTVEGYLGKNLTVNLETGWNMAGYPRRDRRTVSAAIGALLPGDGSDKLVQMMSDTDFFLADAALTQFSTMTHFDPGKGYWIKVNANATWDLSFDEESSASSGALLGGRGLAKAEGGLKFEQLKRQLVTYPSIPAIVLARLVSEIDVPGGSLVGAFADDELRGVQVIKRLADKSTVALVVHVDQSETISFKLWNATAQGWQGIQESMKVDSGEVHGSANEMIRLTLDAQPLAKGLGLSRDSMSLVVAPELLGDYKVQRSTDLIHWEEFPISGENAETGLTIDPDQSHEFYRLIHR